MKELVDITHKTIEENAAVSTGIGAGIGASIGTVLGASKGKEIQTAIIGAGVGALLGWTINGFTKTTKANHPTSSRKYACKD